MEIPYAKVIIYALTFLTYLYTGFGSGFLSNVRDAVITAESLFGDVFTNVVAVAKKFKSLNEVFDAAVEEECKFKCPVESVTPVPNRDHVPSSNGCGSLGLQIDTQYLPVSEMTKCCNVHDVCYDTCNNNKDLCDVEFKRCLYQYCEMYKENVGDTVVKACKGASKLLFTGTLTLGCKSYLDAQSKACYCPNYGRKKGGKHSRYTRGDEF